MNTLCRYRHVLGKENQGFHKTRLFGVALWDVVGTLTIAIIVCYIFDTSFWITVFGLLIVGIILHRLFCVNTTINKLIFGIL